MSTNIERNPARPNPRRAIERELVEATDDLNAAQRRYDDALVAARADGMTDVDIISVCRAAS